MVMGHNATSVEQNVASMERGFLKVKYHEIQSQSLYQREF